MTTSRAEHPDTPKGSAVRLYALRHGEPVRRDLFYGHYDVALSERGHAQAAAQAEALAGAKVVAVYSSDLSRARLGAEAVAAKHDAVAVQIDPALREMHLGRLENVPYADGLRAHPELAGRSYRSMLDFAMPGGGESVRDVAARVVPLLETVAVRHASPARPAVVLYAHNTVTRIVLAHVAGLGPAGYAAFEQRYAAINRVDLPVARGRVQWDAATVVYANRNPTWSEPS